MSDGERSHLGSGTSLPGGWFTENRGQLGEEELLFVHTSSKTSFAFSGDGYLVELRGQDAKSTVLKVSFSGANFVLPQGRDRLPHNNNYLRGSSPAGWITGVPNFQTLVYEDLYDKIDLIFYFSEKGLKYDLRLDPGADPEDILLCYEGCDDIYLGSEGRLHVTTPAGDLVEEAPFSYQKTGKKRQEIPSCFDLEGNTLGFELGAYDPSLPLVIDPLVYSSYLGGGDGDGGHDLAVDPEGNRYFVGGSESSDFPTTAGCYQETKGGNSDVVVVKMNPDGSELVYSTFIGGDGTDVGFAIALDPDNNAYVTGSATSLDFPTTNGCYDSFHNGNRDVFVLKLNPDGSDLVYSTFIGGMDNERAHDIALDQDLNAYITGETESGGYPTTEGCYDDSYGGNAMADAFATALNQDGSDLIYSSFLGDSLTDVGRGIGVDTGKNAYIAGETISDNFPTTAGSYQESKGGSYDPFVLKMNPDGSDLVYSTFVGGSEHDVALALVLDQDNNACVTGASASDDFPTTDGCYSDEQTGDPAKTDVVVFRLSHDGAELLASTYIGGENADRSYDIALDQDNNMYITGNTDSGDFPTTKDCFDDSYNGGGEFLGDSFISGFDKDCKQLLYSSYFGAEAADLGRALTMDEENDLHVLGYTNSTSLPVTEECYQEANAGGYDFFALKLSFEGVNTMPELEIGSPEEGSTVSGTVTISGSASDQDGDETLEKVEVAVDDGDWQTVSGTSSWTYDWDSSGVVDGEHSLVFRAFDGELPSEEEGLTLNVENKGSENVKPVVSILGPEDGAEVLGIVTIEGEASDEDGDETIEYVEISVDDGAWEEAEGTDSWTYDWDTTEFDDGEYLLKVRAYDGQGHSGEEELTLTVANEEPVNYKPTVEISSPQDGIEISGTITIRGEAADPEGSLEKVELSIDGAAWQELEGSTSWSFDWDSTTVEDGEHEFEVRSFDGSQYSETVKLSLSVKNEKEAPVEQDDGGDDDFELAGMNGYLVLGGAGILVLMLAFGVLLVMRRGSEDEYSAEDCPSCGRRGEYFEEQDDLYCWNCEEYFGDMR